MTKGRGSGAHCQRCQRVLRTEGGSCACPIPLLPPSVSCSAKQGFASRLEAESFLAIRIRQWTRDPTRAAEPPMRVYLCQCRRWHLTSQPDRRHDERTE